MRQANALAATSGAVLASLLVGGAYGPTPTRPRTIAWYARLNKPDFTPPGPAFGLAWTILGGLLVYSGTKILTRKKSPHRTRAIALWAANVTGIALWPALFFGRKDLPTSTIAAGGLTAIAALAAGAAAQVDRKAAAASLPLVAWLAFASVLDGEIWRENP